MWLGWGRVQLSSGQPHNKSDVVVKLARDVPWVLRSTRYIHVPLLLNVSRFLRFVGLSHMAKVTASYNKSEDATLVFRPGTSHVWLSSAGSSARAPCSTTYNTKHKHKHHRHYHFHLSFLKSQHNSHLSTRNRHHYGYSYSTESGTRLVSLVR